MLNALKLPASPLPSLSLLEKSKAISPGIPFKKPSHSKQKVICIVASFHLKPSVAILTLKLCEFLAEQEEISVMHCYNRIWICLPTLPSISNNWGRKYCCHHFQHCGLGRRFNAYRHEKTDILKLYFFSVPPSRGQIPVVLDAEKTYSERHKKPWNPPSKRK